MDSKKHTVFVNDRRLLAEHGATVMEALTAEGILLRSDCGGRGRCGKCVVRVQTSHEDHASPPGEEEGRLLGEDAVARGDRLACRVEVRGSLSLEIPAGSLLKLDVAESERALSFARLPLPSAQPASEPGSSRHGIAIDLGTTTIGVYLCDSSRRAVLASTAMRNPQAIFGEDVISRIGAVRKERGALSRLQKMVVRAIDWAVTVLCGKAQVAPDSIERAVAVGNSTMIHLLLREDPSSIGLYPYKPTFTDARKMPAGDAGFRFNPGAALETLPLVSGYVGADLVSAAMALDLPSMPHGTLLADIGTNGEIMLKSEEGLSTTSCATGPALEGAGISCGMQAAEGAIEEVLFNRKTGRLDCQIIAGRHGDAVKPAGICGSGVISTVAELARHGILLESGAFCKGLALEAMRTPDRGPAAFEVVPAAESQTGRAILFTQADVRAVQLAKGALRAGIELLCVEKGLSRPSKILLAGAFGSYLRKADALKIGMLPEVEEEVIEFVGNAAGMGAVLALFQSDRFEAAKDIARKAEVMNLSSHPGFQETFLRFLSL